MLAKPTSQPRPTSAPNSSASVIDADNLALLAQSDLLQGADNDSLAELWRHCLVRQFDAGDTVLAPDRLCYSLHLVLAGCCHELAGSDSKPTDIAYEAGQTIGLNAFARGAPMGVEIQAAEDTRVLIIEAAVLTELINSSHAVARNLSHALLHSQRQPTSLLSPATTVTASATRQVISYVDELTGLHNQRWLARILPRYIMRSSKDQQALSLLAVEIDRYEELQADYGTELSDFVRYSVAQSLVNHARPSDMIARLDEHRFIVILPETDSAGAQAAARRLRQRIGQSPIVIPDECVLPAATVSIGHSQLKAFVAADKLIDEACMALQREQIQRDTSDSAK